MLIDFLYLLHHKQEPIDVVIDFVDHLQHEQESIDVLVDVCRSSPS